MATQLVHVEIIEAFARRSTEIALSPSAKDAHSPMWNVVEKCRRSLAASGHRILHAARERSRPIRVAGHAIADARKTKGELIAENALLRQQLIAAKRHLGRPQLAMPEKLAIIVWARLTSQWQSAFLLFQPDTVLRWHREMFRVVWWRKSPPKGSGTDIEVILSLHPNMNAQCERFMRSLRRECLDHVLLLDEEHLRRVLGEYVRYFNDCRPHQGRGQPIPLGPANGNVVGSGAIVSQPILAGLHHAYRRVA